MKYVSLYWRSSALWPSVRLAAYWFMFAGVILNFGLSFGNGFCTRPGDLKSGNPAFCGDDRPPSHAGMVPAALPAFSPPSGVRSAPSRAASWALMAACAAGTGISATTSAATAANFASFIVIPSERVLDGRGDVVAVPQLVVLIAAAVGRVVQVDFPL